MSDSTVFDVLSTLSREILNTINVHDKDSAIYKAEIFQAVKRAERKIYKIVGDEHE